MHQPILFIDAHDGETTRLALVGKGFLVEHHFASENFSEKLPAEIKKFLAKQKIKIAGLEKIGVVTGPGHFSKIRTAVAAANALAYGLQIPVIGQKSSEKIDWLKLLDQKGSAMAKPFYDRKPNISRPKKYPNPNVQ